MLLTLFLTAWPIAIIAIAGIAIAVLIVKAIKYLNKKNSEDHRD